MGRLLAPYGRNLESAIRDGLARGDALRFAEQIADALIVAHAQQETAP